MKARKTSSVKKVQKSQPSAPEEEEKKSLPSAHVEEEQKNRSIQMTHIEKGQMKFEDFNRGGGKDYRPTIPEFKKDDRADWRIT